MKYKDLQDILYIMKELPDEKQRDKAIRLILQTANESITFDVLQSLLSRQEGKECDKINPGNDTISLKFTNKEINQMPERFRKDFIIQDKIVKCRRRKSGKKTINYEIRYRRDGLNVSACSNNLEAAKEKFIQALLIAERKNAEELARKLAETQALVEAQTNKANMVPTTFHEFAMYYFEKYRKRKVSAKTLENDTYRYKNHIRPHFGSMPLQEITSALCQELLDNIAASGKMKTNNEVYSILNAIFKMAIAHDLMVKNPLAIVIIEKHHSKHGKALTKEEEKILLEGVKGTKYEPIFALALYTGLRPNEMYTAKIEGNFVVARNSKRKGGKTEYKRIPISKMLAPYIIMIKDLELPTLEYIRKMFNQVLPNHIFYDLRTTFYTRCEECGVAGPARDHFVGHSSGELNNTYSDLSDEYLQKEGEKLVW